MKTIISSGTARGTTRERHSAIAVTTTPRATQTEQDAAGPREPRRTFAREQQVDDRRADQERHSEDVERLRDFGPCRVLRNPLQAVDRLAEVGDQCEGHHLERGSDDDMPAAGTSTRVRL